MSGKEKIFYHGTTAENAQKILEEGFDATKAEHQFHGNGIYLASNEKEAKFYGGEDIDGRFAVIQCQINEDKCQFIPKSQTGFGDEYVCQPEDIDIKGVNYYSRVEDPDGQLELSPYIQYEEEQ